MPKATTLILDENSIKQGKIMAAIKGVSLSAFLRATIAEKFEAFQKDALERNTLY